MYNKLLLVTLFLMAICTTKSFSQNYTVTTTSGNAYTPLVNPNLIVKDWDTSLFLDQNIGVSNFNFADMSFDFDGKYPNGMLLFAAGVVAGSASNAAVDLDIDGFFVDIQSSTSATNPSAMNYQVSGNAPNRILKFEWKNAKFTFGDTADFVNLQIWMYESTSNFEVRFGPSLVKDPTKAFGPGFKGPHVGIFFASTVPADNSKILKSFYVYGNPANPKLNSQSFNVTLNSMPASGTTYAFKYHSAAGINNLNSTARSGISIYPNPANSYITIENKNQERLQNISIIDVTGKTIINYSNATIISAKSFNINISTLSKGVYYVQCLNANGMDTKKLVIE